MTQEPVIRFEHVSKSFASKKMNVNAVKNVSLEIQKGEIFGIIGFSGAGKSTLVRCMNLLERPTDGNVFFQGVNLCEVNNKKLREARQKMGMIFQQFNLLEQRNVWENICYPLEIAGVSKKERKPRIEELLELVDLTDKAKAYPSQLSGGQKQRVAIARALATNPEVLLCDEATSALDPITTRSILDLLRKINKTRGVTIVIITHEMKVAEQVCDRVGVMNQGELVELGLVKEIFLHPKSDTARKMILSGGGIQPVELPQSCLRIAFDGKAYGQIVIELPQNEEALHKIESFLDEKGIHYEEGGNVT